MPLIDSCPLTKFQDDKIAFMHSTKQKRVSAIMECFNFGGFLFHGQLAVDFGFSANDNMSVTRPSEFLLIGLRRFKDHLRTNDLDLYSRKLGNGESLLSMR